MIISNCGAMNMSLIKKNPIANLYKRLWQKKGGEKNVNVEGNLKNIKICNFLNGYTC